MYPLDCLYILTPPLPYRRCAKHANYSCCYFLYLYRRVCRVGHNDVVVDVTAERWDMGQRYDLDKIAASHTAFHVKS
jgi:hypothetical protein